MDKMVWICIYLIMKYTEGNVSYFFSPQQRSSGIVALPDDYQNIRREGYFAAGNPLLAALYTTIWDQRSYKCSVLQFYIQHYFPDVERKLFVTATVTDNERNVEEKNELYMYNLQQLLSTNIMKKR